MKYVALTVVAVFALSPVATGPNVGARVPGFTAVDAQGHVQTLESIMGPKGALLVFFRSANW